MNEIETTLSDIKLFIEQLKTDLPEVFTKEADKQQSSGKILYMGNLYEPVIELTPETEASVRMEDGNILIKIPQEDYDISTLAENWLREQAAVVLKERTSQWAQKMGLEFNNIFIKDQKTMWASCSSNKNINYSYRIIKIPSIIMDYLIVHELAHIVHMNHAEDYWALVEQYSPDYKEHRKWLNNNRAHVMADTKITYVPPAAQEEQPAQTQEEQDAAPQAEEPLQEEQENPAQENN